MKKLLSSILIVGLLLTGFTAPTFSQFKRVGGVATWIPLGPFRALADGSDQNSLTVTSFTMKLFQPPQHAHIDTLATNGTFTGNATGWTLGSGWAYGTNNVAATTASTDLEQADVCIEGVAYRVIFTATRSAGSVTPKMGGTSGTERSSAATFSEVIVCGASNMIEFTGNGFTGTIDDVIYYQDALPFTGDANSIKFASAGTYLFEVPAAYTPVFGTYTLCGTITATGTECLDFDGVATASNSANVLGNILTEDTIVDLLDDIIEALGTPAISVSGDLVTLQAVLEAMLDNILEIISIHSGTAQAGAGSTITLDTGANSTNNYYIGSRVYIHNGTGAGQTPRLISAYTGASRLAFVSRAWTTQPDATSEFYIIP